MAELGVGIFMMINYFRSVSAPSLQLGKRLSSPSLRLSHVAFFDPLHVGMSNVAHASSSGHDDVRKGAIAIGSAEKAGAKVIRHQLDPIDVLARSALARDQEYDQIPEDDFTTASLGEEIDFTLFPLAPGPYVMPYPFTDENFKDPDVCRRALDRTITPTELKSTESLLPLQLSNRISVLTALLTSHGTKSGNLGNTSTLEQYSGQDHNRIGEKMNHKNFGFDNLQIGCNWLHDVHTSACHRSGSLEVKGQLGEAEAAAARSSDELARTDAKLSDQALVVRDLENDLALERSKSQEYKDASTTVEHYFDDLSSEVT
ncbi:hypothetical protein Tco_0485379 [Tanacetum coccineum]